VARAVTSDQPQRRAHDFVFCLPQMAQVQVEVELIVERAEGRDVRLDRQVAVERRLPEGVIADPRQSRLAGIGGIAAEALGQHVADFEVLGFLGGTEREEQLRVHAKRA
jgi:hypothetical protein